METIVNIPGRMILDGSQRGLEGGKWRLYTDIMPSITAREYKEPRNVMEVIQLGNIANEKNFKNPQIGRVYDVGGGESNVKHYARWKSRTKSVDTVQIG